LGVPDSKLLTLTPARALTLCLVDSFKHFRFKSIPSCSIWRLIANTVALLHTLMS